MPPDATKNQVVSTSSGNQNSTASVDAKADGSHQENPKTAADFRRLAKARFDEANEINNSASAAGEKLTKEKVEKIKSLLAEFNDLKAQSEALDLLDDAAAVVSRPLPLKSKASDPEPDQRGGLLGPTQAPGHDGSSQIAGLRAWASPRDHEVERRHGFRSLGEFCLHVHNAGMVLQGARGPLGAMDERLYFHAAATGMRQASGADGGFLVPPAFSTVIWDGLNNTAENLLSLTDNYTIEAGQESLTFPANGETTRVGGSVYGGVIAYWLAEADQIPNTKAKLRQMKIEPQQLAALVYVTDKLLRNATALDQFVTRASTDAINFQVGNAILRGNGVGQPLGILNSGSLVTITKETSQLAGTFQGLNAVKMFGRLHPRMRASAVWLINVDVTSQLWRYSNVPVLDPTSTTAVGGAMLPIFNPEKYTILGRPIVETEYNSTVGTAGDVVLAAMKAYATGTRGGIDAAVSMHLRFDFAESAFRFIFEVDGQPWLNAPLTPAQGTNTLSSFVAVETRS